MFIKICVSAVAVGVSVGMTIWAMKQKDKTIEKLEQQVEEGDRKLAKQHQKLLRYRRDIYSLQRQLIAVHQVEMLPFIPEEAAIEQMMEADNRQLQSQNRQIAILRRRLNAALKMPAIPEEADVAELKMKIINLERTIETMEEEEDRMIAIFNSNMNMH